MKSPSLVVDAAPRRITIEPASGTDGSAVDNKSFGDKLTLAFIRRVAKSGGSSCLQSFSSRDIYLEKILRPLVVYVFLLAASGCGQT